jgi:hypothetical protein
MQPAVTERCVFQAGYEPESTVAFILHRQCSGGGIGWIGRPGSQQQHASSAATPAVSSPAPPGATRAARLSVRRAQVEGPAGSYR